MALSNIEHLVEATGNVEAHSGCCGDVATLGNLLVGKPALVGKGKFELVAVLACALRAKTGAHLRDIQVADTHQLVLYLLGLLVELLLIGQTLPLTATTYAKVLAEWLYAQWRLLDEAHYGGLHKSAVVLAHLNIDNIAGHGHRHKNNLIVNLAHRLALGSKCGDMQTLNQGVILSSLSHRLTRLKSLCTVALGILFQYIVALPVEVLKAGAAAKAEAGVGDGQTHRHKLCLVGGLYRQHLIGIA